MSFEALKKRSTGNAADRIADLQKKLESETKTDYSDDRMWYPVRDKNKVAFAVIRFLPSYPDTDGLPWAKQYTHGFQGPSGRWYIENCPTTINKKCPVCEANSELWATGTDEGKNIARSRKRRLNYYSNIFIVKDPATPENEGKVFLFRYGQKIFDKIQSALKPEFESETPFNPFDLWTGANFKLKVQQVHGQTNYDKSEFEACGPLMDDDGQLEKIWKSQYSLTEFTEEGIFKTYSELLNRFQSVIGNKSVGTPAEENQEWDSGDSEEVSEETGPQKPRETPSVDPEVEESVDDVLASFRNMAEEE